VKWTYTPNPEAEIPVMLIDKHIGKDENGENGIMGDVFLRELLELEKMGKEGVDVWVNSAGGAVLDGWNIYSGLTKSKMNITTINIGIAASTAGWIFEAGKKRVMMDYAIMMVHNPHGSEDGMDEITESISIMLAAKSNQTVEHIRGLMDATTFMTAEEAYAKGMCDEVKLSKELDEIKTFNKYEGVVEKWGAANLILNKLLPKNNKMSEVAKVVNEMDDKQDATIIPAQKHNDMDDTANKDGDCRNDDDEALDKSNSYDDLKNQYDDLMKKYKEISDSFETLKKERESAARSKADDEMKNMLDAAVSLGKITQESVGSWKNTAKKIGAVETKKLIDELPVNLKSPISTVADVKNVTPKVPIDVASWRKSLTNKK